MFMLELVFENTEDYFNIINQTTNGQSLQKIEKHSEKGYYMYNISSYSDFPNRLAYTVCNDEMKTVTYLLMVDTAYKLESDAIVFFDMSLPSEWYIYKDNDLKERCMYTLYQYKVPTGSIAFGEINIVEEDEYGRILYEVPVSGVMTSEKECQNMCVYLVCQKYDENTVWYYDSECMVISKQLGLNVRKELNKLKKNNDWETEIDISKCTSRKVMSSYFEKNVEFDESKLEGLLFENMEEKTVVYDVCDKDQNGRMLVFVREKSYDSDGNLQLGVPFVMVIEEDDNSDYKIVSDGKVQMNGIKDLQAVESVKRKTFWNNTVND